MKENTKTTVEIIKLGLILAIFALVACVGLAFVYGFTKPTILANEAIEFGIKLRSLFPDAEVDINKDKLDLAAAKIESGDPKVKIEAAYLVKQNGIVRGIAIKASGPSYGSRSSVLVGVGLNRTIVGVSILENNDTPGLGANANSPTYFVDPSKTTTWPGQFANKPLTDPFEVKKDVVVITASTITSRALTNMIKRSGDAGKTYLETIAQEAAK